MRICHATTFYPNRYGHTHYTDALIAAMRRHRPERHFIAAEFGSDFADTEAYHCVPCFGRDLDYVEPIVDVARGFRADLVIVQYTDDLFGHDGRLPRLLRRLREAGIATLVNAHSVYPQSHRRAYSPGHDAGHLDRALASEASSLMVHTARMRQELLDRGVPADKVAVIPHGTYVLPVPDPLESRRRVGVAEDAKVIVFFGFIWLGKGLEFLLEVFARVLRQVPAAQLLIGGTTFNDAFYARAYLAYLRARTYQLRIARRTRLWGDYVSDELVPHFFSAADVVAFPYRQGYSSVSGVLHQAVGLGRPVVCSRIAKFEEVAEQVAPELLVGPRDREGWTRQLVRLLSDDDYAMAASKRAWRFAGRTSWDVVALEQLQLCDRLVDSR